MNPLIEAIEQSVRSADGSLEDWLAAVNARCDLYEEAGVCNPLFYPRCPLTECVRQLARNPPPRLQAFWWGRLARLIERGKVGPTWMQAANACRVPDRGSVAVVKFAGGVWSAGVFRRYLSENFDYNLESVETGPTPGEAVAGMMGRVEARPRRVDWKE